MSNTPMHDVQMLKVLVWTQLHSSASAVKETPDRLAVCTVVRAVTHRLLLKGGVLEGRGGGSCSGPNKKGGGGAYYRYRLLLLLASYFFEAIVQPHETPNQPSGASCLKVSTLCGALFWVPC